jgi:DNA-binding response OmpR family regulator
MMKTILCIDDDAWVLDLLMQALTQRGYRVLVTTSTKAGPNCLKFEKIDLVLLDLNMPSKPGLVVFRELESVTTVPVLFVTGCTRSFNADSEKIRKEYEQEFRLARTDVLAKPFTLAQLYQKVESLIGPGNPGEICDDMVIADERPSWIHRLTHWRPYSKNQPVPSPTEA